MQFRSSFLFIINIHEYIALKWEGAKDAYLFLQPIPDHEIKFDLESTGDWVDKWSDRTA